MATVGERLARLEQRQAELWQLIHGGQDVEWKQSIRGRLHDVQQRLASEEALTQAIREVRRTNNRRLAMWVQIALVLCGVVGAVAAVIAAVAQLSG